MEQCKASVPQPRNLHQRINYSDGNSRYVLSSQAFTKTTQSMTAKTKQIYKIIENVIAQIGSAKSWYIRSTDSYQNAKQLKSTLDFGPIIASLVRAHV